MAGRYFDEWTVGDTITHQPSRTVTETDNLLFSAMTHNTQPLHLDAEAAKASESEAEFRRELVSKSDYQLQQAFSILKVQQLLQSKNGK